MADYVARVCAAVADGFFPETELRLELGGFVAVWPGDRCWRLALIICELIRNAARHGDEGAIVAELSVAGSDLVCRVTNPGICPPSPELGRGRRVVAALAGELGGRADWLFTPHGACAWVILPLEGGAHDEVR